MNVWEHCIHKKEKNNTSGENWIKLIWFNPFIIYYSLTKSYTSQVKTISGWMIVTQTCPLGWVDSEFFFVPLKLWSWTMKSAWSAYPKDRDFQVTLSNQASNAYKLKKCSFFKISFLQYCLQNYNSKTWATTKHKQY